MIFSMFKTKKKKHSPKKKAIAKKKFAKRKPKIKNRVVRPIPKKKKKIEGDSGVFDSSGGFEPTFIPASVGHEKPDAVLALEEELKQGIRAMLVSQNVPMPNRIFSKRKEN